MSKIIKWDNNIGQDVIIKWNEKTWARNNTNKSIQIWFKSQRIKVAFQTDESAAGGTIWDLKSAMLLLKTCFQCYKRRSSRRIKNSVNNAKYNMRCVTVVSHDLRETLFLLLLQSSHNLTKVQSYQKTCEMYPFSIFGQFFYTPVWGLWWHYWTKAEFYVFDSWLWVEQWNQGSLRRLN